MIIDALLEQGKDVTDELLQPVEVWPVAEPYLVAFHVLSNSRRQDMSGVQAIEYSEIVQYAENNGYAESIVELEEFVSLVQAQDREYLNCAAKK